MKKLIWFFLLLSACRNYTDQPDQTADKAAMDQKIEEANKQLVKEEAAQIDAFVLRHHFSMQMTGTGLRYEIFAHGTGTSLPLQHDLVQISYKMFFLDGTLCSQTDAANPPSFRLGEGTETRGLEEGIMMMKEGDKARFIVPEHLAFGLTGDGKKIPPATTLYYDITLHKISK